MIYNVKIVKNSLFSAFSEIPINDINAINYKNVVFCKKRLKI